MIKNPSTDRVARLEQKQRENGRVQRKRWAHPEDWSEIDRLIYNLNKKREVRGKAPDPAPREYEDLLRSARQATEGEHQDDYGADELRRLVSALADAVQSIAAAERERCAALVDPKPPLVPSDHEWLALELAADRIREA